MLKKDNRLTVFILVACALVAFIWCMILQQRARVREAAYLRQATYMEMRHLFSLATACLPEVPPGEFLVPSRPTKQAMTILDGCVVSGMQPEKVFLWPDVPNRVIHDGWGNPIWLHPVNDQGWFLLRSFGPNGVDDGGKGDDIEYREPRPDAAVGG